MTFGEFSINYLKCYGIMWVIAFTLQLTSELLKRPK